MTPEPEQHTAKPVDNLLRILQQRNFDAERQADESPVTAKVFRDAVREHARLTRPRNSADSYEAVARRVGYHALQLLVIWLILGAPGYPPAKDVRDSVLEWVWSHDLLLALGAGVFFSIWAFGKSESPRERTREIAEAVTEWPFELLGTFARLFGVAVIGACAAMPVAVVLRSLGLAQ